MVVQVLDLTPSHVVILLDGKNYRIEGEALLRGYGSPDFVLYRNSVSGLTMPLDEALRERVLSATKSVLDEMGITSEIE